MQVRLIVEGKNHPGQVVPINVPSFLIGQAKGCDLRSGSSSISRHHCIISTGHDVISIQDLNTENGTYVNGERILFPKRLQHGDKIVVGKLSFVIDMQEPMEPEPENNPEDEDELIFDIKVDGQRVSVTKKRLLYLAKQGKVLPDDVITIDGTKVFADTVQDIVFGKKSTNASSPTESAIYTVQDPVPPRTSNPETAVTDSAIFGYFKKEMEEIPVDTETFAPQSELPQREASDTKPSRVKETDSDPFNIKDEPVSKIVRPSKTEKSVFSEIGEKIAPSLDNVDSSRIKDWIARNKKYFPHVLGVLCLLGLIGIYLSWGEASPPGIYYVRGILTLDGKPVEGVNVLLHPRGNDGESAGGLSDVRGRFTVTTGIAPVGSGAKAGIYDITFSKTESERKGSSATVLQRKFGNRRLEVKYLIPKKYDNPKTSGLSPITITADGTNNFTFELLSGGTKPESREKTDTAETSPQKTTALPYDNIFDAIKKGTVADVKQFLENGTDINAKNPAGNTPLLYAIDNNSYLSIVKTLISEGADVSAKNPLGETPLYLAIKRNYSIDIIKDLISRGSNVNIRDRSGRTMLHFTASAPQNTRSNMVEIMKLLLSNKAFVNVKDGTGRMPLDVANTEEKKDLLRAAGAVESVHPTQATTRPVPPPPPVIVKPFVLAPPPEPPAVIGPIPPLSVTQPAEMQHNMGLRFYQGTEGIPQDKAEALKWFHAAAQKGHADAQFRVGTYYYFGWEDVSVNEPEAVKWLQKAASQGHKEADSLLQHIDRQSKLFGTSP